jgi:hypothetical protein
MVVSGRVILMPRLATSLVFLAALSLASYAQTSSPCGCSGRSVYSNSGGEDSHLTWKFDAIQKNTSDATDQKVICYVRNVTNHSPSEVRDVRWDVAKYRRAAIPANAPRPTCNEYIGEINPRLEQGPLHHGVSSQAYDTTVRPPESGWLTKQAQSVEFYDPDRKYLPAPVLKSTFVFDTRGKDGRLLEAHVLIESSTIFKGPFSLLTFGIANDGDGIVGILLNIRALPNMYANVPAAEKPFYLKPKSRVTFQSEVPDRAAFAPATVVFYNEDGKEAALETAGFYVPATGKTILPDEALWSSAR